MKIVRFLPACHKKPMGHKLKSLLNDLRRDPNDRTLHSCSVAFEEGQGLLQFDLDADLLEDLQGRIMNSFDISAAQRLILSSR